MIHYDIRGDEGSWIVFVHGLTCDGTDWAPQVAELSGRHRCVTVDLRGHGRSAALPPPYDIDTLAGDVAGLMHGLAIENAVLVGHSMGTRVITAVALQVPERVHGLVFVDGSRQGHGDPIQAQAAILEAIGEGERQHAYVGGMFDAMFTSRSDPATRTKIVDRALSMPAERFRALVSNMAAWDAGRLEPALAQVVQPVHVVQSTNVTPQRRRLTLSANERTPYLEMLAARLRNVTLEIVPDTGHFTQLDAAETVTRAVAAMAHAED
jgi:pimeloyl-ACP methyl ester carboxylesterase